MKIFALFFTAIILSISSILTAKQNDLEIFFTYLFSGDFAYTLFGNKPMSINTYNPNYDSPWHMAIIKNGWSEWEKNKNKFSNSNFVLRKISSDSLEEILFINKKACRNLIYKNLDRFQVHLGKEYNVDKIFLLLLEDNQFLVNINAELLGLLLGYGRGNSLIFSERYDLCYSINKLTPVPINEKYELLNDEGRMFVRSYSKHKINPTNSKTDIIELQKNLNELIEKTGFFELENTDYLLDRFETPVFITNTDSDEETKMIYDDFMKTREVIFEAYKNKPFMQVTLDQWMKND